MSMIVCLEDNSGGEYRGKCVYDGQFEIATNLYHIHIKGKKHYTVEMKFIVFLKSEC